MHILFCGCESFNPFAPSNVNSVSAAYRCHEITKRHAYGQRIQEIELASFTLIVMSAAVGFTPTKPLLSTKDLLHSWHQNGVMSTV